VCFVCFILLYQSSVWLLHFNKLLLLLTPGSGIARVTDTGREHGSRPVFTAGVCTERCYRCRCGWRRRRRAGRRASVRRWRRASLRGPCQSPSDRRSRAARRTARRTTTRTPACNSPRPLHHNGRTGTAGFSLSRALFTKNVGPLPNIGLRIPPDWFHTTRAVTALSSSTIISGMLLCCKKLPVLLWGTHFRGAPVRPNMLNIPKSASGRTMHTDPDSS